MRKRLTAALLCFCLLFTLLPATAFAEGASDSGTPLVPSTLVQSTQAQSALCEHHPSHDEACGYTEGTEGSPCTHEHDEDCYQLVTECVHEHSPECYPAESVSENTATPSQPEEADPTACTHVCSEESGCITKTLACNHTHDEACGYAPATEGTPCTFVCEVCNAQDSRNPATPSDAQPEECTCETLCTEEEINADCPVCSVEGAELDKVCVGAALLLTAPTLRTGEIELYVGGQQIKESGCYENKSGTWTKVDGTEPANGQFSYDADSVTLTLNEAKIVNYQYVTVGGGFTYPGSVIAFSQSADVSLTIEVSQGTSNITGTGGIRVVSKAGDASLSISGPGSLEVNVDKNDSGISLIGSKNVNLNIDGADVKTLAAYYYGVDLHAGDGFKAAAVVNNGKLTAGGSGGIGIYYRWTNPSDSGTSSLTVSGNAVVDTRDSKILIASQASEVQVSAGSDGNGGIVFDGKSGTVYGDVTLQEDLEIGEGESLDIPSEASLTIPEGTTLTVNGGELKGNVPQSGVVYKVTEVKLDKTSLTLDVNESETLTATITPDNATDQNVAWSSDPSNIVTITPDTSDSKKATITATGTGTTTIKATVDGKSVTCSVTVNAAANVPVTSVSLNKDSLTLGVGSEETLTASITPGNATNQNVTWSSDDTSVATVDATGKVNAMGAGTATITVTTADGGKTATCTVTVNPVQYTVTVQTDGNGTASASPATATAGTTVTLTADPDSGYHFERWEIVSGGVTISGNQFTMPAGNVTVKAVFDRNSSGGGYVPTRPWRPSRPVELEDPAEPETPALNGWVQRDGVWYLYKDGSPATGWNLYNGTWYYLDSTGRMLTGWQAIGGVWYYLLDWGGMATGWLNLNGTWYYLRDWGGMATGWLNLNGTWYYLHDWGGMATGWLNLNGAWYYLKDWGGMAVGWLNLNGTWYYLKDWGGMASNTTVDGYYLDVSGAGMA